DVYFRAKRASISTYDIYATRTLAEANAITGLIADTNAARDAAGVMAYKRLASLVSSPVTETLTNNAGIPPDLSSLTYTRTAIQSGDFDAVFGYVAAPAGIVMREVEWELEARVSTGQILEGYHASRIKKARAGVEIMSRAKQIVATSASFEATVASAAEHAGAVEFTILVGDLAPDGEEYIELIERAGSIASLFVDELITLNGVVPAGIMLASIEDPEEVDGEEEPYTAARINFRAQFPRLFSDRS
ncbi:MAG: hypothetical protein MUQ30_09655, partial [Anaerolineae bacterium]|nr:hypothetical protein [Anaerolineae bacterium]